MNTPIYSSHEMVRLEILAYPNPEGLHSIEESWRDLCRKLIQHAQACQEMVELAKTNPYRFKEAVTDWKPFKFPTPFQEAQP